MYELEKEWQTASDGFDAGVDFKAWLANVDDNYGYAEQRNFD